MCLRCPPGCTPRSAQCPTGQPPRTTAPVRLSRQRGRPPACHRRGRSSLPSPSRDRADGATLGRPRHPPRRTRRPARRDANTANRDTDSDSASRTLHPHEQPGRWRSTGRAGVDIVPTMPFGQPPRSAQCPTGQPSRCTLPVRLSTPRGRPPARHRRGRSLLPSPSRDRADGATLGRPRHEPRRTRRPALPDTTPLALRKGQAPPLPNRRRFREGGRCSPSEPLPFFYPLSRKRNHRLETLRRRPRHDLATPQPKIVMR